MLLAGIPPSAPPWVIYVSASLTILLILDLLYRWLEPARLQIRVTKELFVRWVERGEVLFVNVVMLATKAPVVVTNVKVSLLRSSGSAKSYPLGVVLVGEKVKGDQVLATHHFFTKSTLEFVAGNTTHRRLYMCELEEYAEESRSIVADFEGRIIDIRGRYISDPIELPNLAPETAAEMVREMETIVKQYAERLFKRVQIERGTYELGVTVQYRRPARVILQQRTSETSSRLRFEIRDNFDLLIRTGLEDCLRSKVLVLVTRQAGEIKYPEYEPYSVTELESAS